MSISGIRNKKREKYYSCPKIFMMLRDRRIFERLSMGKKYNVAYILLILSLSNY